MKFLLDEFDANPPAGSDKDVLTGVYEENREKLADLQTRLFAEGRRRVLCIFQGMDTAGKNGVIKKVFALTDPNGVHVTAFGRPTEPERARDFLWRVHARVPATGEVGIFNRSHYEDVVAARVRGGLDVDRCRRRYDHINAFESLLVDEGTLLLKFFLHVDKAEQRSRLKKRIDNPSKQWKLDPSDFADRKLWEKYQIAYEEALTATHTETAPWNVVPANAKWYRNVVVAQVVVDALEKLNLKYPEPKVDVTTLKFE